MQVFSMMQHSDLRCALYCAEVSIFQVLVTGRRSDVIKCSRALLQVEELLKVIKEKYSDIIEAEVYLFKSILLLISGERLKAFFTMRNSWKIFKKYEKS